MTKLVMMALLGLKGIRGSVVDFCFWEEGGWGGG